MSSVLFAQYTPIHPIAYDARVNIFNGKPFPKFLDNIEVDSHTGEVFVPNVRRCELTEPCERSFNDHALHRAVIEELTQSFEDKETAHTNLFHRLFTVEKNDSGRSYAKNRRGVGFQRWVSVWGYCMILHHERQYDLSYMPVWTPHIHHTSIGRYERTHPSLETIHQIVAMNEIPAGKKRPRGTKQHIRTILKRAGHDLIADQSNGVTRAKLLSSWRQW
tara:strand:- start:22 stop:678 length:657 start_codon:yes stop_codon:yes gene_type:complete